jgi:hypothetical protein
MKMSANTITMTVQLGSGGFAIGRNLADRLGFRYFDWEVTSQAADEAGVSPDVVASAERLPSMAERIMERFFNAGFYAGDIPEAVVPTSTTMDSAIQALSTGNYRDLIAEVVLDLSRRHSCIIVGHAAQVVLRNEPGVLKVLVHGSAERRARRVSLDESLPFEKALEAIHASDRDRANFFKHYYKVNLLDASLYDIAINTDTLTDEHATSIIAEAAQGLVFAKV